MTTPQQTTPQQQPEAPQLAIPITPQNYPVLNRWMSLELREFREELNVLAAMGRDSAQPDTVQRAVRAAVSALEALHGRR